MCSGERPTGAAKGDQTGLVPTPPPRVPQPWTTTFSPPPPPPPPPSRGWKFDLRECAGDQMAKGLGGRWGASRAVASHIWIALATRRSGGGGGAVRVHLRTDGQLRADTVRLCGAHLRDRGTACEGRRGGAWGDPSLRTETRDQDPLRRICSDALVKGHTRRTVAEGGGGRMAAWAPPPDPPIPHIRKLFLRKQKDICQRGPKLEVNFRYKKLFFGL